MRGQSNDMFKVMSRCKVHICALQVVRWRDSFARLVKGKDSRYKFFWVGNDKGTGGFATLLAEKWVEIIFMLSMFQIESCLSNLLQEKVL